MAYKHTKVWRIKNPDKWNEQKKKNYAQTSGWGNRQNHCRWTSEETEILSSSIVSDRKLHQTLGRSVQSIQVKRSRLRVIL